MQCVITTKGIDEFITYVDKEKSEVVIYHNNNKIANPAMECNSAAYDGRRLIYTEKNKNSVFVTDIDNSYLKEVSVSYSKLSIQKILSEFDNFVLLKTDDKYIIYDYINGEEVLDCSSLKLDLIYDLYMDKYGIGQAAGYYRERNDDEQWCYQAVTFRCGFEQHRPEIECALKYSLYEDFYGRMICYDSSKGNSGKGSARIPIFYVYKDAYSAKAVSKNYIVYVPGYNNHVVVIADVCGRIHRLLAYPTSISNCSWFAYNETTDIVTIATGSGKIYRYYVNTVGAVMLEDLVRAYNQSPPHSDSEVKKALKAALDKAQGLLEDEDESYAAKMAIYKARDYCFKNKFFGDPMLSDVGFRTLMNGLEIKSLTDTTADIKVDPDFILKILKDAYTKPFEEAFKELLGHEVDVKIEIDISD